MVRERIQYSIRTLFWLSLLAGLSCVLGRWFLNYVPRPAAQLSSFGIGAASGFALILIREHLPRTALLNGLLLAGLVANGFWIETAFPDYRGGVASGILAAWRGELLLITALSYAGLIVSTDEFVEPSADRREPADEA